MIQSIPRHALSTLIAVFFVTASLAGVPSEARAACLNPPAGDADCDLIPDASDPCPADALNRCAGPVATCSAASDNCSSAGTEIRFDAGPGAPTNDCRVPIATWAAETGPLGSNFAGSPGVTIDGSTVTAAFGCTDGDTEAMVKSERFNNPVSRTYPVANGDYVVNLLFAEAFQNGCTAGAGFRVFDVFVEGSEVLSDFDQYATALAENGVGCGSLVVRSFETTVSDGLLEISMPIDPSSMDGNAALKAIEVIALPSCTVDGDCDDSNACTDDACVSGVCQNSPVTDGTPCDDGEICNENDVCTAGVCGGTFTDADNDGLGDVSPPSLACDPCPGEPLNECFGPVAVDGTTTDDIRINASLGQACSGARTDCRGAAWNADFGFTQDAPKVSATTNPIAGLNAVFGCSDGDTEDLLQCERWDQAALPELVYDFDVPDGNYLVNILFANTFNGTSAPGSRVFDVAIEGQLALDDFDQIVASGGDLTAVVRSAVANVSGGDGLQIEFLHDVAENPAVKAIEVLAQGECLVDADCEDGLFCNGAETCDGATATCQAGTPPVLDDGVACTDDSCDEGLDQVVNTPNDANCDDANVCNGAETCDAVNDCQAGIPLNPDDGVACTDDTCDPITGVANTPNDANCDDANVCNGAETCDAVNDCQAGIPLNPDDGVACTDDTCDPITGVANTPNDANCDDANVCNGAETCDAVNDCQAGIPLNPDDGVACTDDTCDPITGVANTPNDANCDDANVCNGAETCDAVNDCQAGIPLNPDDGVACTDDTCDPITGVANTPNDANCDDANVCNGAETCDAVNDCQAGIPLNPDDGVACTDDTCDPITGVANTPNDANCDNGLFCDGTETCDALNDCQPGTDPCQPGELCGEDFDVCGECVADVDCDPGEFCSLPIGSCETPGVNAGAQVTIDAGGGIDSSTFNNGSFQITNTSTGGQEITAITIDLSTAILPDMVFDPVGDAGDVTGKCFTPNSGAGTVGLVPVGDACADPFSGPHDGGFDAITLSFTDFQPGETFTFSVDVDPTSIQGATVTCNAGCVSGLELSGASTIVAFDDASMHMAETFAIDGSVTGSQVEAVNDPPGQPALEVLGFTTLPATTVIPNQTVRVHAPDGSSVRLLHVEAELLLTAVPGGGFDLDPFEANSAVDVTHLAGTAGPGDFVDFPVTLTNSTAGGGLNHLVAVIEGSTGPLSDVAILDFSECTPTGQSEAICNGVDDDCDDQIDEDLVAQATACGVGACQSIGQTQCVGGVPSDTCAPNPPVAEVCNGVDDDCDGVVDNGLACPAVCGDGIDNDGDGAIDLADWGCFGAGDTSERAEDLACDDGIDNDGDGQVDFPADPQCLLRIWASETLPCADGLDNDGDGLVDLADAACQFPAWPFEADECADGVDNDGDTFTDVADPGCTDALGPSESPACSDGVDNDGDGLIDHPADPQCASAAQVQESVPFCGLGFEVVFLTPLIQRVVRKRRRRR